MNPQHAGLPPIESVQLFPDFVPQNPDGTAKQEETIDIEQAKQIGALDAESYHYNSDLLHKVKQKSDGAKEVRWGEGRALHLSETVRLMVPPQNVLCIVTRINPTPVLEYAPFVLAHTRNQQEFYEYLMKNIHKISVEATYQVEFKEKAMMRGKGTITLPDTMSEHMTMQPPGPPGHYYPPPPAGYGAPPMPPPQAQVWYPQSPAMPPPQVVASPTAYNYDNTPREKLDPQARAQQQAVDLQQQQQQHAQQQQAAAQAAVQAAPAPAPAVLPASAPSPSAPDPVLFGVLQEVQRMMQMMHQNQIQVAQALGALEEMKRQAAQQQHYSATTPPMDPRALGQYLPAYPQQSPSSQAQYPVGYPQPQSMPMPMGSMQAHPLGPGFSGMPMPPNPMTEFQKATDTILDMTKAVSSLRSAMSQLPGMETQGGASAGNAGQRLYDDEDYAPAAPTPPFHIMPLGNGDNAPKAAFNSQDGSVNMFGTIMANLPQISGLAQEVKGIVDKMGEQERAQEEQRYKQRMAMLQAQQRAQEAAQPRLGSMPSGYPAPTSAQHVPPIRPPQEIMPNSSANGTGGALSQMLG